MYSVVALVVFIVGFITSSSAVCPDNPTVRAKECVVLFAHFRNCSEIYGALECLREIMNDCEDYENMGIPMSPEDYERTKSGVDAICAGDKPTNDVARDISKNDDDTEARPPVSGLLQHQERDLTQSNTFNGRATEKECQTMSESCLTIVDSLGDASGQREVMCNGMRSMLTCLQNVLTECADHLDDYNIDTLMAGYQQHLGMYCGPGPMPGGRGPMTGGLEPMPGGPGPMPGGSGPKQVLYQCEDKFNECGYIGAQLESPGAQDPVARCVVMRQHAECNDQLLADCGSLMPDRIRQRLTAAGEQYNQICNLDSNERDLTQSNTLSARATEKDLTQSNTLSARATEKECQTMSESCLTIVDSLGDASGQREVMCNGMRSMLSCLQNVLDLCADHLDDYNIDTLMAGYQQHLGMYCNGNGNGISGPGPMPSGPGPMSGGPGQMPGEQGAKQVLYQCEDKFNECGYIGAQLESPGMQDPIARCVVMRQHAECNDQLLADCGSLMPDRIRQRLAAAGQQYNQICNLDFNEMDLTQSNTLSARATEKECQTMSESCLTIVDSLGDASGQREVMCNGMRSMLTCLQNVLTECADHLDDYNIDTLMAGYQQHLGMYCNGNENGIGGSGPMPGGPGPMPGGPGGPGGQGPKQVLSNCENKFNECGQYGDQLGTSGSQDPVARCVVLRKHAECNEQLLADCGALMPEYIKQSLAAAGQQYNQICPASNEAVVPKKKPGRLPPAKCDARISKCKSKLVGYEAGNKEKCLQGYKTMRCYRRVAKVCKLVRPIRKEIKAFKKAHINTCGRKKPRDVDDDDDLDDSLDVYIAWLDGDNIDDD